MILNLKRVTRIFKSCAAALTATVICVFACTQNVKAQNATFLVSGTGVPDSIMTVVEHCATKWSEYVVSDVPIHVSVSWQELQSNVNAYASPTTYYAVDGVYYPVPLAEKLQQKNLNGSNADIEVVVNKKMKFSVDVESSTPSADGRYDLASTVMHEFAHGLGLIGNITVETLNSVEFPAPTIYDMYIADENGKSIVTRKGESFVIDTSVLRSEKMYWNGRYGKAFMQQTLKLYAPKAFNSGSTAYHLDEETYSYESGYALLTPKLTQKDIFRDVDVATLAILADMGWNDYFVSNQTTVTNNSNFSESILVKAYVGELLRNTEGQTILYSFDGGKHIVELPTTTNDNSVYSAEIPAFAFDHTVSYAIRSVTSAGDTVYAPSEFPSKWYTIFVGDDTEAPVIENTDLSFVHTTVEKFSLSPVISDQFGIKTAYVDYFIARGKTCLLDTTRVNLEFSPNGTMALLDFTTATGKILEGDVLYYVIVAEDEAGNQATFPADSKWYAVPFEEPLDPIRYLVTDFEDDDIQNYFVLDKCSISLSEGFSDKALHTAHPYANSGVDGKYNQYVATLKYPVVIASNPAIISFDEVVLVEPGKAGIDFGTFGFWDYVVVEGAKSLDSDTWYALGKKGWDSQLSQVWQTQFYSNTKRDGDNENSLATGDATMYRSHVINLLENKYFRAGDTIFIRFRLQADATNYGWGWAIDNLKIQERVALPIPMVAESSLVYPNPCGDWLYVSDSQVKSVSVYDASGNRVVSTTQIPVATSSLNPGFYFVKVELVSGEIRTEKVLKR